MAPKVAKKTKLSKRQSVYSRLSWFCLIKPVEVTRKEWRVKKLALPLSPTIRLVISFRKFRTKKTNHSKLIKQFVFRIYFLPLTIKEVAIVKSRHKRQAHKLNFQLLPVSQLVALLIMVVGISGITYFGLHIKTHPNLSLSVSTVSASPMPVYPLPEVLKIFPRSEPTSITIPKINVSSSLVAVGLRRDGTMQTPNSPNVAGWYDLAPTPGELGPAIIVGHVDSMDGPAIFWRLRELQPGDIIQISRADSTTVKFKIDAVKQFPQSNIPTQQIYGNLDYSGIRLITCGGVFNTSTRHYSDNTVVMGSLVI